MNDLLVAALFLLGAVGLALSARALSALRRERRFGALESLDMGRAGRTIFAPSAGLVGRPDEIRRLADGRSIPIELKSRRAPRAGPSASHVLQVEAYCFLLEESTGRSPPFGVLRYADHMEWEIPWNAAARAEVWRALSGVRARYGGEATPTPGKCRSCTWMEVCDARAPASA